MKANRWKEYFLFTKKERTGIITMLAVIVAIWFLPAAFPPSRQADIQKLEIFKTQIAAQQKEDSIIVSNTATDHLSHSISSNAIAGTGSLFYFDPNTLSPGEWKKLGLHDKTISTILNYVGKGGRFIKPEDLSKIYGLKKADYERLAPYVRIALPDNVKRKDDNTASSKQFKQERVKVVDINAADTSAFIALPGIGSRLANRIINFRQKLGGFYTVEQVAEVYGIADSVFQKIRPKLMCNAKDVHLINVNTVTVDELKAHPYIKYQVANAVIQYRNQHGNYISVESLKQVHLVTEELFRKIMPYMVVR